MRKTVFKISREVKVGPIVLTMKIWRITSYEEWANLVADEDRVKGDKVAD
jgi:hypothetical protein